MYYQVEVTTKCNLACFYCAGRMMAQKHMGVDIYKKILDSAPADLEYICLQGEGEPVLNKVIWSMTRLAKQRSIPTYTITNAAYRLTESLADAIDSNFDRIGVSLDTTNPDFSRRIGRFYLPKTLETIENLVNRLGPRRVDVYTVALSGKSVDEVNQYVSGLSGVRHVVQPIQRKDDYQLNYRINNSSERHRYRCRYIENNIMRFFNVDGTEMPCCYIKGSESFRSIAHIESQLLSRIIPDCCSGCRELY